MACRQNYRSGERGVGGVDRLLLPPPSPLHPDIFFLYWGDSSDFIEVNRLVVRWLVGLGHRVLDLSDEGLQEELVSSPELWITDKLEDPNTKVIVVESETVNECLRGGEAALQPALVAYEKQDERLTVLHKMDQEVGLAPPRNLPARTR